MIYRLKELQGDTIAVPQLVFSKLGIAEEYNVRVALYVLATGITDPDKICADLKLRSRISAESALSFWAGAGLLERYEENAAPGAEPSAPAPMTWAEIAAASRTDPMISSLIDCAQTGFARPLTHREMEKLVNLYVQEGFAPETVMLCVAYVASCGKRTMAAVVHELKVWRTPTPTSSCWPCAGAGNSTSAACWASPPTSSPWAAARPLPAGTRCTATMTPWYRKLLYRQAPSGTCGTGTAS